MRLEWTSRHTPSSHAPPPSAVHGWLLWIRGLLTFDSHERHRGDREIQEARALEHYRRGRRESHRRRHRKHGDDADVVDARTGRRYRESSRERNHPFLHYPNRCRPWYHGDHHRFWGFVTGHDARIHKGRMMRESAARERRRERRRRLRDLRAAGMAIRYGETVADY